MNDLVVAIHGAIAELVAEDPELAETAARFLPVYADPEGPGWIGYARELQGELGGDEGAVPGLVDALTALAAPRDPEEEAHPPSPPVQARLLLAVAMLVRLDPARHTEERRELLVGALLPVVVDHDRDSAERLLRLLEDDDVFPSRESWQFLLGQAAEEGLVSAELAEMSPPCTGVTVITTAGAGPVEVAELVTDCSSTGVTLAQVKAVLDPLNWDDCSDYFCQIVDLGVRPDGWSEMLERVSLSCPTIPPFNTGIKYFKFDFPDGGGGLNYDLSDPQPPGADGQVVVDRGSIIVRPEPGGGVRVRSTKQVRFRLAGLTSWMATFACLAGWSDVGQELLFGCALGEGGGSAWTVSEVPASAEERVAGDPQPTPEVDLGQRIDESVARMRSDIDQLSSAWVAHLGRAGRGEVTVEDLAAMTGDLAARSVREVLRNTDLACRVVGRRGTRVPDEPEEEEEEPR